MKKAIPIVILAGSILALANVNESKQAATPAETYRADLSADRPKRGYVPDQETAIAIAVAVWSPIYGKVTIESGGPYEASLKDGIWTVTRSYSEGHKGGIEARISQADGCILKINIFK